MALALRTTFFRHRHHIVAKYSPEFEPYANRVNYTTLNERIIKLQRKENFEVRSQEVVDEALEKRPVLPDLPPFNSMDSIDEDAIVIEKWHDDNWKKLQEISKEVDESKGLGT